MTPVYTVRMPSEEDGEYDKMQLSSMLLGQCKVGHGPGASGSERASYRRCLHDVSVV